MSSLQRSYAARMVLVAGAFALTLGVIAQAPPAGPVVATTGGRLQGELLSAGGEAVFKGIPYAAPPVGELRWREPQPAQPWAATRDATHFAAPCAQVAQGTFNKQEAENSKEDCLYLNVWTPEWPARSAKPVMLWIHGGANAGGSAAHFDGASLASHGVLVVTINYRLGLFGFMGHPELTAESPHHASGGYGLLDQIAALRWVHDNIAHFGGDPANVTVFGQSAGAHDTSILVTSPLTKGLIRRAIIESGSATMGEKRVETPADREQMGVIIADVLKAPKTGTLAYMRGLPTSAILNATPTFREVLQNRHLVLDVGTDGYAAPRFSAELYLAGKEPALPMIFGSNGRDNPEWRFTAQGSPEELRKQMRERLAAYYIRYPDLSAQVLSLYGLEGQETSASTYAPYGPPDVQLGTDMAQRCSTKAISIWHSTVAPTFVYEFTAGSPSHPPGHSAELAFVFNDLRDQESVSGLRELSEKMESYWTNFAKTGDPNGPELQPWPIFDNSARKYVEFSNEGVLQKSDLRKAQCALYQEELTRDLKARMAH